MTDETRLAKLQQAQALIREVEFSYPVGAPERVGLYQLIAYQFSLLGWTGNYMYRLKKNLGLA